MTTLFTTTLETALTGTNGFTSVGAAPTLDTASTIKGAQCARWNSATAGVGTLQPASDQSTVYFSFYFKANSYPAAPRFFRAVDSAGDMLGGVLLKARFWQRWAATPLNARQAKVLNRVLDGFEGKLTSSKWAALAKCSPDTALRDIHELMALGVLRRAEGGGRSSAYELEA